MTPDSNRPTLPNEIEAADTGPIIATLRGDFERYCEWGLDLPDAYSEVFADFLCEDAVGCLLATDSRETANALGPRVVADFLVKRVSPTNWLSLIVTPKEYEGFGAKEPDGAKCLIALRSELLDRILLDFGLASKLRLSDYRHWPVTNENRDAYAGFFCDKLLPRLLRTWCRKQRQGLLEQPDTMHGLLHYLSREAHKRTHLLEFRRDWYYGAKRRKRNTTSKGLELTETVDLEYRSPGDLDITSESISPFDTLALQEARAPLRAALEQVSESHRDVFIVSYLTVLYGVPEWSEIVRATLERCANRNGRPLLDFEKWAVGYANDNTRNWKDCPQLECGALRTILGVQYSERTLKSNRTEAIESIKNLLLAEATPWQEY